jgi:hypothetical protein
MHEHGVSGRPVPDRRAGQRRQGPRRRAGGPRPVRPAAGVVPVRPAEPERPWVARSGGRRVPLPARSVRTLTRRPRAVQPGAGVLQRVRRVLAGLVVAVAAGVVVVGLGVLVDTAAAARAGEAARVAQDRAVVTVGVERTPWDVARRVAPAASGPELAALAEQIVTENSLAPVPLQPGQVLRVTSG